MPSRAGRKWLWNGTRFSTKSSLRLRPLTASAARRSSSDAALDPDDLVANEAGRHIRIAICRHRFKVVQQRAHRLAPIPKLGD